MFSPKCGHSAAPNGRGPAVAPDHGEGESRALQPALPDFSERVKNLLLTPRAEWPAIAAEPTTTGQLYSSYVTPLAAFASLMSFLRMSVVGITLPFGTGTYRTPFFNGLLSAVVTFILGLIGLYLVGLAINALAPTFSGVRDQRLALRVAAYALTPAWLGTALTFLPMGSLLQFLAGAYGIYVLYLGLPVLMQSAQQNAAGYTATVVVCTVLIGILIGIVGAALYGPTATAGGAMAAGEPRQLEPVSFNTLKSMLPASLPQMERTNAEGGTQQALGVTSTSAAADYQRPGSVQGPGPDSDGPAHVRIKIVDLTAVSGLIEAASGFVPKVETRSDSGYERDTLVNGREVHEKYNQESRSGELEVLIAKRFDIQITGTGIGMDQLERILASLDLARLEGMKRAHPQSP